MDSLLETINRLLTNVVDGIVIVFPKLFVALLVFVVGLFLAWLIKKLIRQFILYLDRNINDRLKKQLLSVDLKSSAVFISRTFYWIILILTVAIVTHIVGLPILTTWFDGLITYLPNILAAILIVFAGIITGKLTSDLLKSAVSRTGFGKGEHLGRFVQITILGISIIIAIDQVGIDIQFLTNLIIITLAALLFGAALAFGLGAQASVNNILGAYYVQKMYREGDRIKIGDNEGVIIRFTSTSVYLESDSGQIVVPAGDFNREKSSLIKK